MSDTPGEYRPRCKNLCCKSMLVFGEQFEQDPEYQDGATDFWCMDTSQGLGPDGRSVSLTLCSSSQRSCYQEF